MRSTVIIILITITFLACKQQVMQYPVSYSNDDFMKLSQERGKKLLQNQTQVIENYIKNQSQKFTTTPYGIWISNSGKKSSSMASSGDYIKYKYRVLDLANNKIYTYDEIGLEEAVIGKKDLTRAMHSALQLIEKGDSATILSPSFLAYGGLGDRNKIASDEPLVFQIKVLDIKQK